MSARARTAALGENHRRVVSAVLRRVETTCDEVLVWLDRRGSRLQQIRDDISETQAKELRELVSDLRQELQETQDEIGVDSNVQLRSRAIAAAVSLTRVELEELLTPGLRGYGALPPGQEAALDARFKRLLARLEAMSNVARCNKP